MGVLQTGALICISSGFFEPRLQNRKTVRTVHLARSPLTSKQTVAGSNPAGIANNIQRVARPSDFNLTARTRAVDPTPLTQGRQGP